MCTLILGRDVIAAGTLLVAANRDEDPARPSDPPMVLQDVPRVVGGRDRVAGGTWLAVARGRYVAAVLNRRVRVPDTESPPPRSRGLLAFEAARTGFDIVEALHEAVRRELYAPFSLLLGTAKSAAAFGYEGGGADLSVRTVEPGWHVITHADLDDRGEPRTAWLLDQLERFTPGDRDDAERHIGELLAVHAGAAPAVCIHEGRMVTVSSARVWLAAGESSLWHAEGRPCEAPFLDYSHLLAGAPASRR
jgi:uncharacterized protein with NRDE domain